jgi:hypothetical protein
MSSPWINELDQVWLVGAVDRGGVHVEFGLPGIEEKKWMKGRRLQREGRNVGTLVHAV